jgi:hypothetical protein
MEIVMSCLIFKKSLKHIRNGLIKIIIMNCKQMDLPKYFIILISQPILRLICFTYINLKSEYPIANIGIVRQSLKICISYLGVLICDAKMLKHTTTLLKCGLTINQK